MTYQASSPVTRLVLRKFSDVSNDLSAFRPLVHRRRALINAAKFYFRLNGERMS